MLVMTAMMGGGRAPVDHKPSTTDVVPEPTFDLEDFCSNSGLRCEKLAGQKAIIYPSRRTPSRGFLLWDAGGPGVRPLDADAARVALPTWTRGYDLVVLPEPWVSLAIDERCLNSVRPGRARTAGSGCPWPLLVVDPGEYLKWVAAFEARFGPFSGVYASSFGAVRSLPAILRVASRSGFAVVEAPAPWSSVRGNEIARIRVAAARKAIIGTPGCEPRECARREQIVARIRRDGVTDIPADTFDLATLGMAYALDDNTEFLAELWRDGGDPGRVGAVSLRQVASRFSLVTGRGTPLPERVGYLAGMCSTYRGWPSGGDAFARLHAPCAEVAASSHVTWASRVPITNRARSRILLVINETDPVVPFSLQQTWKDAVRPDATLSFAQAAHTSAPRPAAARVEHWLKSLG